MMSRSLAQQQETTGAAPAACCAGGACGPAPTPLNRREFLRAAAAAAALSGAGPLTAIAGPFEADDFERLVPRDKRLSAEWLASLTARGTPAVLRGAELEHVGMPIGGICCGQLYLGGDGRLWHWDIFNQPPRGEFNSSAGPHYAKPAKPGSPIEQSFSITIDGHAPRALDREGFREIEFRGQYPVGAVSWRDADCPLAVEMEAFSPFCPLDADESGLPATLLHFTLRNVGDRPLALLFEGTLQNGVCLGAGGDVAGLRRNRVLRGERLLYLNCTAEPPAPGSRPALREPIVFERFENDVYKGWTATGTAFGSGPVEIARRPKYMGEINGQGERYANTHNVARGENVVDADKHVGTLTSEPFTIERHYITLLLGGGGHAGATCVNLLVDDRVVRSLTGSNSNRLRPQSIDVREFEGRTARLQLVDTATAGWGQTAVDDIVFADLPRTGSARLEEREDYGTLCLGLLDPQTGDSGRAARGAPDSGTAPQTATAALSEKLVGSLARKIDLAAGATARATFVLAWHFPRVWSEPLAHVTGIAGLRRHYAARFDSAAAVVRYVSERADELSARTRLWRDTWYDSTLPHWLLDRTFLNTSIAATATCLRFDNDRFYGWEGNYCCAGTCTHVWQYAHALARVFPSLERRTREHVDFGIAFHEDTGAMDYRAEAHTIVAHDGQAGTILRALREHQISADDGFLRRCWPRIRKAIEHLIREDRDEDGLLEGAQYNTLDAAWHGPMAWISSLYLAAVRAGEAMAREADDAEFAARCAAIAERGSRTIVERLFDGEYFIHLPDPAHPEANNTNRGCHIDQVFGQSWAFQVGLPRVIPREQTLSALRALWRYSFTPDVGLYREGIKETIKGGRWYAMPGEGGLLMCTFPKGGAEQATGKGGDAWAAGYFNECMNGFEYQVAAHMIWEGMVQEGLAITRMIHDRYAAARRNPWNEIECGDHYARSMASYGVFTAACGFDYHGPRGMIAFAPRVSPEDFRTPFIAAEGWGTYSQKHIPQQVAGAASGLSATLTLRWGRLRLREVRLRAAGAGGVRAQHRKPGGSAEEIAAQVTTHAADDGPERRVTLTDELILQAGEELLLTL